MHYPYALKIEIHHDCWSNTTERVPDTTLEAFGIGCDENSAFGMVKMSGSEIDKKRLYDLIKREPNVIETRKRNENHFFIRIKKDTSFYINLLNKRYITKNTVIMSDGTETETLFGFSKKALRDSLAILREDREVRILSFEPFQDRSLTQKEQELLSLAVKEGYYEIPRRIYASELGDVFGLKKSVILDRLRRIERKLVNQYFGSY